ncbi:protein of unknown function [Xenorhabdus doucetiae]|uniref:Uncharacterized protein n=1 Tax=Xenorhabdus doucetiae TaxID=351671 RepID=A0A068QS13_9GAMM|nr:protein of unknown function [Xenorhabdus doucetiae]
MYPRQHYIAYFSFAIPLISCWLYGLFNAIRDVGLRLPL